MTINDIVQTIAEARADARSLSEFVFKPAGFKVTRRLAPSVDTLQFYIDRFDATKAASDAYIATIPSIVNDAINNTAVEGGVLADTFVTATALPDGVALTQAQKNKRIVYIEDFDEVGSLDKGIALRKAVAYLDSIGGGTLLFEPSKVYECSLIVLPTGVRGAAYIPNKVHLNLQGSEIKTNSAVNYFSYNILDFELSNTNSVNNGTLRGNASYTPTSISGEWGFGIGFRSTKNFSSRNLTILECGGDGVYLGCHIIDKGTPEARTNVPSQNINFDNLVIKDCLRQGISLISADNVNINNLTVENIVGKSPEAGVDFEPNYPEQQLTRIIINNFKSSGCKRGILFNFAKFDKTTKPVSITINNYSDADSRDNAIHFKNGNMRDDYGFIHFTGKTHLKNSVKAQLHIACSEGTDIIFDDLTIESDSTSTNTNPLDLGQNTRIADADAVGVGLQNITIKSLRVYGVMFRKFGTIHTNNNTTGVVKNINIHVDDARIADPLVSAQFELTLSNVTNPDKLGNFINLTGKEKVYNVRDTAFTLNKDAVGRVVLQAEINLNVVTEGIPFTLIASSTTTNFVTVIPSGSHKFSLPGAAIAQRMKLANGGHIKAMRTGDTYRILSGVGFELLPVAVPVP